MQLAKVVGTVVATLKDPALEGRKLLVLQPIAPTGAPSGAPVIAIDGVGVGAGEQVFFVRGREAAFAFLPDQVVADASIVGKIDSIDMKPEGGGARRAPSSPSGAVSRSAARSAERRAAGVGPRGNDDERGERASRRGERELKK